MKTNRLVKQIAFLLLAIVLFYASPNITQGQDTTDLKNILESQQYILEIESIQVPIRNNANIGNRNLASDNPIQFLDPSLNYISVSPIICAIHLPLYKSRYYNADDFDPFYIIPIIGNMDTHTITPMKRKSGYIIKFTMRTTPSIMSNTGIGFWIINFKVFADRTVVGDYSNLLFKGKLILDDE